MAARHAPPEWAPLADEMLLADELGQALRSHPGRERLLLGRRLEERLGSSAACLRSCCGHDRSLGGREVTSIAAGIAADDA